MRLGLVVGGLVLVGGCYAGARATRDVNEAWRGRSRGELLDRWGKPAREIPDGMVWSRHHLEIELPEASAELHVEPGRVEGYAAFKPGVIYTSTTDTAVHLDPAGNVAAIEGPSLRWGAPDGLNLRWGTIFGFDVGMGTTGDTTTPLPSGGVYLGGMLSPTLGLAGVFSLVSGEAAGGGAMDFAWGIGAQWWPASRVWLRAGPALVLAFRPGFDDGHFAPGATGGASFALVRAGTFVLDLRVDVTVAPSDVFGCVGIGVNLN